MGTYNKKFNVNWLHISHDENKIVINYDELVELDSLDIIKNKTENIIIDGENYNSFYDIEISYNEENYKFGDLLKSLIIQNISNINNDFDVKKSNLI